jgi:hypothetical protein
LATSALLGEPTKPTKALNYFGIFSKPKEYKENEVIKMQTLDDIFAHATQLSDAEFGVLLSAMMREQKERDSRKEQAAWGRVLDALNDYTKAYGSVSVMRTGDQPCNAIILRSREFTSPAFGELEVEA